MMKKVFYLFTALCLLCFSVNSWAQILFEEPFDYAVGTGDLVSQSGNVWRYFEATSGNETSVISGSLSYSGRSSSGNKVVFDGGGKGYFRAFTGQETGSLYGSCIINVKSLPTSTAGDHFIFFGNSSATMSPVYIRPSSVAGKFNIGLGKRKGSQVTWMSDNLNLNTSYFIVFSYTALDGGNNDISQLWLNPANFDIEPISDVLISTGADANELKNLVRLGLNHSDANNNVGLQIEIDEIRVSTTWSGAPPVVPVSVAVGTYYIDSDNGDDNNDGLSPGAAWKSLAKVNASIFQPGSKLLFKTGGVWIGQLAPLGSGTAGSPIIIDQYGDGPKPFFNGNGIIASGVVKLFNQSFWEINNLRITNDALVNAERRGVEINASNYGLVQHIHLRNLEIHHIRGTIGGALSDKRSAGIYFTVSNDDVVPTRYDDILVEGCLIYQCQNQGIVTSNEVTVSNYPGTPAWENRKITNLVIRNNIIHHISKNAMIIRLADGGIVERNLCYETATGTTGNTIFSRSSRNTVFQYNEGYLNRALENGEYDGSLYDPDLNSPGTIWQYSYSHDNSDGLIVFCTDPRDDGIIVRYNISQNDKGDLVKINFPFTEAHIYNNTFYIGAGYKPVIIKEIEEEHTYTFQNNIVYNADGNAVTNPRYIFVNTKQNRTLTNNIFYRTPTPAQLNIAQNLTLDPMFVNPGKATIGLNTVGGYQLKPGSPALAAGVLIPNNGGQDYFGNTVSATALPNIGFYNGPGTTSDVLPVELLDFTGEKNPQGIALSWKTASEKNNARFIIERAIDGKSFIRIGKKAGAGNSLIPLRYSYIDKNPYTGTNYYRLKQIDFDGNYSYSKNDVAVDFNFSDDGALVLYPNPVKELLFVKLRGSNERPVKLSIYNLQGKKVDESVQDMSEGSISRKVGFLGDGTYILEVRDAYTHAVLGTAKFIKQ